MRRTFWRTSRSTDSRKKSFTGYVESENPSSDQTRMPSSSQSE